MSDVNLFTEKTSKLLFSPVSLTDKALTRAYYHHNGQEHFCYGVAVSALFLTQAIISIAAVPLQIIAGTFACIHQFSKVKFEEGTKEFKHGVKTSLCHAGTVPLSTLVSIAAALYIIATVPYSICTWNRNSQWWTPGVA